MPLEPEDVAAAVVAIIRPLIGDVADLQAAVAEMAEKLEAREQLIDASYADTQQAYRVQVLAEAARLGIGAGELAKMKRAIEP